MLAPTAAEEHPPHPVPPGGAPLAARGVAGRLARFLGRNWARVGYARHIEPTWLSVARVAVPVAGLPPALAGLRVAQLSDFHHGPHIPRGFLEGAVERAAAERPDLIALTGDFIDRGRDFVPAAARLFRGLTAPMGVFAVLGNHDFAVHTARGVRRHPDLHAEMTDALGAEGVTVLRNRAVSTARAGAALTVAGVDDLWSGGCDPAAALGAACPAAPRIVLAHNPQTAPELTGFRPDLILSGHTHGGQINLPNVGRVFLGKKARRWAAGLYRLERGHLYVNPGVGFGWRFRFGVRPEVTVLTLHPAR